MYRYTSFCFLLIFVWYSIGIGYAYTFNTHQLGVIGVVTDKEVKKYSFLPIQATLSAHEKVEEYESVTFVGDVLLARNVEYLMRENDSSYPFQGLDLSSLGVSSAVVGNFEAAIPREHVPTPIGQIDFSVSTESIHGLTEAGFTHVSLANNHSFDFGSEDFNNTQTILAKSISHFGHPRSMASEYVEIIEVSTKKVALVGINGLREFNDEEFKEVLSEASKKSEVQIVYIHWGEEYSLKHNQSQEEFAKKLVDYGADLIIGHHPHVVQGVDLVNEVPVFYSLGNYVFDQYFSKDVQEGLVVSLNFDNGMEISLLPVTSKTTLSQPRIMNPKDHALFLEKLARKSHPDLQEQIIKGLISEDVEIATSTKVAIMHDIKTYVQ